MNKKGFTLIELVAVIAIIGILMGIASISYVYIIKRTNNRVYESYMDSMYQAATMYLLDNPNLQPIGNEVIQITLNNLNINPINNPRNSNDTCPNSYVEVYRQNDKETIAFGYKVALKCADYTYEDVEDNCLTTLGDKCITYND